jgi:malonate-semialdehyde dehydrogenase (acetylating)/methylmalonate-semialdehyde dehydrogenase
LLLAGLDLAADQAGQTPGLGPGERCVAISAVLAVGEIGDGLVDKIRKRALALRAGDGTGDGDWGPLATSPCRRRVSGFTGAGEAEGSNVSGRRDTVRPVDHVTTDMTIHTKEIFGHARGSDGVDVLTRGKVITSRWLEPSHREPQPRASAERLAGAPASADDRCQFQEMV